MAFEETPTERREVSVRRAPRYVPFMILGGVVGFVVAGLIAFALPGSPAFDANAVFGFFLIVCAIGGVLLGAITALILDRLSVKRSRTAVVEAVPDSTADSPSDSGPDDAGPRPGGS